MNECVTSFGLVAFFLNSYLIIADIYQNFNFLHGPHCRQRHLKLGRGRQKYDFLYDRDIHSRNRTRIRNIGTMHMFLGQFFMGNLNFEVL